MSLGAIGPLLGDVGLLEPLPEVVSSPLVTDGLPDGALARHRSHFIRTERRRIEGVERLVDRARRAREVRHDQREVCFVERDALDGVPEACHERGAGRVCFIEKERDIRAERRADALQRFGRKIQLEQIVEQAERRRGV